LVIPAPLEALPAAIRPAPALIMPCSGCSICIGLQAGCWLSLALLR
jgi:hypothetical protein